MQAHVASCIHAGYRVINGHGIKLEVTVVIISKTAHRYVLSVAVDNVLDNRHYYDNLCYVTKLGYSLYHGLVCMPVM